MVPEVSSSSLMAAVVWGCPQESGVRSLPGDPTPSWASPTLHPGPPGQVRVGAGLCREGRLSWQVGLRLTPPLPPIFPM